MLGFIWLDGLPIPRKNSVCVESVEGCSVLEEDNSELRRRNSATSLCSASMSINEGTSALILVEGSGDDSGISLSFRCIPEQTFCGIIFWHAGNDIARRGILVLLC